jgi:hypothetical protein
MAKHPKEEYDWLNDPFDDKKLAKEREESRMSTGGKVGIGCGCFIALLIAIGIAVYFAFSVAGLSTSF